MIKIKSLFIGSRLFLFLIFFLGNCVLPHTLEANFWNERKLAQLAPQKPYSLPTKIKTKKIIVPTQFGTLQEKSSINQLNSNTVIHIQDIHQNHEAQFNISQTIGYLIKNRQIDLIALEGAWDRIDLSEFKNYPNQKHVRLASKYLLKENVIAGPIHTLLTTRDTLPIVIGVDDEVHYKANVEAYRISSRFKVQSSDEIQKLKEKIQKSKKVVFNENLLEFDELVQSYREGETGFGHYINQLKENGPASNYEMIEIFSLALEAEQAIDFEEVNKQRSQLIQRLMHRLSQKEIKQFLSMSLGYQSKKVSQIEFYSHIKELCLKHKIDLKKYSAIDQFLNYVFLSDQIKSDPLFDEIRVAEKEIYDSLAKTKQEKEMVRKSRELFLAEKLINFELNPNEWNEYVSTVGAGLRARPIAWAPAYLGGHGGPPLQSFENFYIQAENRDKTMAENLKKAMKKYNAKTVILVTGGFHSKGIQKRLSNVEIVSFIPKVSEIDAKNGSAYLTAFTQEKTPLEKIFENEKLFLAKQPWTVLTKIKLLQLLNLFNPKLTQNQFRAFFEKAKEKIFQSQDPDLKPNGYPLLFKWNILPAFISGLTVGLILFSKTTLSFVHQGQILISVLAMLSLFNFFLTVLRKKLNVTALTLLFLALYLALNPYGNGISLVTTIISIFIGILAHDYGWHYTVGKLVLRWLKKNGADVNENILTWFSLFKSIQIRVPVVGHMTRQATDNLRNEKNKQWNQTLFGRITTFLSGIPATEPSAAIRYLIASAWISVIPLAALTIFLWIVFTSFYPTPLLTNLAGKVTGQALVVFIVLNLTSMIPVKKIVSSIFEWEVFEKVRQRKFKKIWGNKNRREALIVQHFGLGKNNFIPEEMPNDQSELLRLYLHNLRVKVYGEIDKIQNETEGIDHSTIDFYIETLNKSFVKEHLAVAKDEAIPNNFDPEDLVDLEANYVTFLKKYFRLLNQQQLTRQTFSEEINFIEKVSYNLYKKRAKKAWVPYETDGDLVHQEINLGQRTYIPNTNIETVKERRTIPTPRPGQPIVVFMDIHGTVLQPTWREELFEIFKKGTMSSRSKWSEEKIRRWINIHAGGRISRELIAAFAEAANLDHEELRELSWKLKDPTREKMKMKAVAQVADFVKEMQERGAIVVGLSGSPLDKIVTQLEKTYFNEDENLLSLFQKGNSRLYGRQSGEKHPEVLIEIERYRGEKIKNILEDFSLDNPFVISINDWHGDAKPIHNMGGVAVGFPQGEFPDERLTNREVLTAEDPVDLVINGYSEYKALADFLVGKRPYDDRPKIKANPPPSLTFLQNLLPKMALTLTFIGFSFLSTYTIIYFYTSGFPEFYWFAVSAIGAKLFFLATLLFKKPNDLSSMTHRKMKRVINDIINHFPLNIQDQRLLAEDPYLFLTLHLRLDQFAKASQYGFSIEEKTLLATQIITILEHVIKHKDEISALLQNLGDFVNNFNAELTRIEPILKGNENLTGEEAVQFVTKLVLPVFEHKQSSGWFLIFYRVVIIVAFENLFLIPFGITAILWLKGMSGLTPVFLLLSYLGLLVFPLSHRKTKIKEHLNLLRGFTVMVALYVLNIKLILLLPIGSQSLALALGLTAPSLFHSFHNGFLELRRLGLVSKDNLLYRIWVFFFGDTLFSIETFKSLPAEESLHIQSISGQLPNRTHQKILDALGKPKPVLNFKEHEMKKAKFRQKFA